MKERQVRYKTFECPFIDVTVRSVNDAEQQWRNSIPGSSTKVWIYVYVILDFPWRHFLTSSCRRQRGENACGKEGRNEFNCTLRGDLQGANTKASLQSPPLPTPSPPTSQTTSKTSTYISLRLLVIEWHIRNESQEIQFHISASRELTLQSPCFTYMHSRIRIYYIIHQNDDRFSHAVPVYKHWHHLFPTP